MKRLIVVTLGLLTVVAFTGCLNVEKKEYWFKIKADGSGEGIIRYVNIVSSDEDDQDVSFKDYATLVTDYVDGTKFEDEHPGLKVAEKKLYEKDGVLCGEFKFTFPSLDSAGFFWQKDCDCCPVLHFVKTDMGSENVIETNGKLIEDIASSAFVAWEPGTREFSFTTSVMSDTSGARGLVGHYRAWKDKK